MLKREMSQNCWKRVTPLIVLLAVLMVIINFIVYRFVSVIIVANSKSTSVVVVADFEQKSHSKLKPPMNLSGTNETKLKTIRGLTTSMTDQSIAPTQESVKVQKDDPIQSHSFLYKIVPKIDCSSSKLVICAVGSRANNKTRQTIRQTWGSYANVSSNNSTLIFFLGSEHPSTNGSQSVQHFINKEAELYGDILQEDYVDHYNNLSLKSVSILKWVSLKCPESQFLLKVDDDMYINVPVLIKSLDDISKSKGKDYPFVVGHVFQGARPIRSTSSKWYTPVTVFNETVYPKYTSGTSYAMTTSAAKLLYKASLEVPVFWLEDVYVTGLCARKANVEVIHNNLFYFDKREASGCSFQNQISGHRYTATEIERIHKELYHNTTKCN
ncbi:beta-1,3-galactosyltransferase 1-like isoform X1 [Biomphalaria glabrata]|uniref:Hexosyltransferase n=2 Tax=Biomphalaria glabrata TaxID=6526 RepID=A0A9W2YVA3_BIOGL|nr:beta-1,3-galactosyltransferase 1-like isoform X1 [Biomphalaria glabrata]